jgi:hypothetical protein
MKMIVEEAGKITLLGTTEESKEIILLKDVLQIIWNNISTTSNPQVTFTFKDERPSIEIFFEIEQACDKFLKHASQLIKDDSAKRREMFIVKQSFNTSVKAEWLSNTTGLRPRKFSNRPLAIKIHWV